MRWHRASLGTLLLTLFAHCALAATPERVLVLDPFGGDFAPFSPAVSAFRGTLTRNLGEPIFRVRQRDEARAHQSETRS
jgi:hypothetical protein